MSITVVNYLDQELVNRIHEQAAARTAAASASSTEGADFAASLNESTKALSSGSTDRRKCLCTFFCQYCQKKVQRHFLLSVLPAMVLLLLRRQPHLPLPCPRHRIMKLILRKHPRLTELRLLS